MEKALTTTRKFYHSLADRALAGELLPRDTALEILTSKDIDLFKLLDAAYEVRQTHWQKDITVHIINNGQNGYCPEDCAYCAQAKSAKADIEQYPLKSDEEFMAEAKNAYEKGAHRYCMVFAGRGPNTRRTEHLADLIKKIKSKYPLEICVSAGLLDDEKATILKNAGLDRLNHNLNTSEKNYNSICTTHTYQDRVNTLSAARKAGLQLCSGMIIGMKETVADILDVAYKLREMNVESIPVNMLIPIPGAKLDYSPDLTPEFCLRTFALFRFINPKAEIRVAAGREMYLKNLEVLAFYAANSLFIDGYLNTKGAERLNTFTMLRDAGFTLKSEHTLDELIQNEASNPQPRSYGQPRTAVSLMKDLEDLRPHQKSQAL